MKTINIILAVLTFIVMYYVTQMCVYQKTEGVLINLLCAFWMAVSVIGLYFIWREITKNIKDE